MYLVDNGHQSATIRSYCSAIKAVLVADGYDWNDDLVLLASITKACRLINDKVKCRLPINCGLLETMLFELTRLFPQQNYLDTLYKAIFALSYYGLMRIGEITFGNHTLKAKDLHIGMNKDKMLIVLYTSKTHTRANLPRKIKIEAKEWSQLDQSQIRNRFFCPFQLIRNYIHLR